jgi:glycosyltransferase involved in cell wall biosynthesis
MLASVALILPARNEEEALGATLAETTGLGLAQVIVVDNGSRDCTAEVARACGAQVVAEPEGGYGQACLAGIAALHPAIEIVAFMDADGSDNPSDLPKLVAPIARGEADLVIGSRELGVREPGSLAPAQRWGNRLATTLVRLLFGARYTDLGPFRAIRRSALERLGMRDRNYGWTIEMQIRAHQYGLRVLELPARHRRRRAGQSKISGTLRGSLRAGGKILWTIFRARFLQPADRPAGPRP